MLLWLWCRPAAVAPIRPLAWELPYAMGAALKSKKTKKKKKKKKEKKFYFQSLADPTRIHTNFSSMGWKGAARPMGQLDLGFSQDF